MRILSFNLWHGLDGQGLLSFGELESESAKDGRKKRQAQQIQTLVPDIVFVQEANPVAGECARLAEILSYHEVHCADQTGIKLGSVGAPYNLYSGLGILARADMQLKKLQAVKLSGGAGLASRHLRFQLDEFRFALIGEVAVGDEKILVINAHLHHGVERTAFLDHELSRALASGLLSTLEFAEIQDVIDAADARRESEMQVLMDALKPLWSKYSKCILTGDLNSGEHGAAYQLLIKNGFGDGYLMGSRGATEKSSGRDVVSNATGGRRDYTWDAERNPRNHLFGERFKIPAPDFGRPEIASIFIRNNQTPRRLDFVMLRGFGDAGVTDGGSASSGAVKGARLFGPELSIEDMTSDHFGVVVDLVL